MKYTIASLLLAATALAADKNAFPGQAGNDNIELRAEVFIDPAQIKQEIGSELDPGVIVLRVKATNKTGEGLRVGPADFVLVARNDGDRADPLEPGQLAGGSALVLKKDPAGRDYAQQTNTPPWLGVAGKTDKPKNEELLAALKSKLLPDQELKPNESIGGLLYFGMERKKHKTKDFSLLYKGSGGRLGVDFK